MHYFRRVKRGYNQSEVIAGAIAKVSEGATIAKILASKGMRSQTGLMRAERLVNVGDMFEFVEESRAISRDSRVVLIDDVFTTGATARECCKVLRLAGFTDLHVLTLAHG
jgi:predicted amidophosphoribosyltransferase